MAGHPQSSARGYSSKTRVDVGAIKLTANSTGILAPSAGYSFNWPGGGGMGEVGSYRDQSVKSDILQHSESWDQKAVATDLGYCFLDVV